MKTYNKTFLPETITYKGEVYTRNSMISVDVMLHNNVTTRSISASLRKEGRKCLMVNVLPNNLKGRTDFFGNLYKPTQHIYTT